MAEVGTQGVPYDYKSIMHYQEFAGTKNGQRVIVRLTNIFEPLYIGQFNFPSVYDFLHVNLLYCNGEYDKPLMKCVCVCVCVCV